MRRTLSNKESKDIFSAEHKIGKQDKLEQEDNIILVNGHAYYFLHDGKLQPSLKNPELNLKKITVDMGAIPFIVKGADIMRPGITQIEDGINQGDTVQIIDEKHGKALCIGIALLGSAEMKASASGKVIKNLHYVGDRIWNCV